MGPIRAASPVRFLTRAPPAPGSPASGFRHAGWNSVESVWSTPDHRPGASNFHPERRRAGTRQRCPKPYAPATARKSDHSSVPTPSTASFAAPDYTLPYCRRQACRTVATRVRVTGVRPEAGRQSLQQVNNCCIQRRSTLQPLPDQQPHHHQRAIDGIAEPAFGPIIGRLDETGRKKFLKKRKNPGDRQFSRSRKAYGRAAAGCSVR